MANEHSHSFDGRWGREIREAEAKEKALRAATPPTTPSAAAMRAAEEIVPDCLSRTCFIRQCSRDHCWGCDDSKQERERVAAIITRHLPGTTSVVRNYDDAYRRACAVLETKGLPVRVGNVVSEDNHRLAHAIAIEFAATTSPEIPVGGEARISSRVISVIADVLSCGVPVQAETIDASNVLVPADLFDGLARVHRELTERCESVQCVKCGHNNIDREGRCKFQILHPKHLYGNYPVRYCGCKCEFSAVQAVVAK